jgi:hypothetical protein
MRSKNDRFWDALLVSIGSDLAKFYAGEGRQLDMERDFEFLDQEMKVLDLEEEVPGRVLIDRLIKVFGQDGEEEWFLIHLGMTAREGLGKQLFDCACRVGTLCNRRVTPFWVKLGVEEDAKEVNYGKLTYELRYLGNYTDEELSQKTAGSPRLQMKLLMATSIMLKEMEPPKEEAILNFLKGMMELDEEAERLFEVRLMELKGILRWKTSNNSCHLFLKKGD